MDTEAAARAWADAWARCWRSLDAEVLEALGEEEGEPEVWMGEPIVAGDRAAIEWWACVIENGNQISLAGTSIIRFREDGRVAPFRGWASGASGA